MNIIHDFKTQPDKIALRWDDALGKYAYVLVREKPLNIIQLDNKKHANKIAKHYGLKLPKIPKF